MPRWLFFLIFLAIAVLVVGGVHLYLYQRLVVGPQVPAPWRLVLEVLLLVLAVSIPLSFPLSHSLPPGVARPFLLPVYLWLGAMMMLFVLLLSLDLVRGAAWMGDRLLNEGRWFAAEGRSLLVARGMAAFAAAIVLAATAVGAVRGLRLPVVKPVEVTLDGLPPELDGFTIAQLTDLHMGPMRDRAWLAQVVERTNALRPDLVAITGDLADGRPAELGTRVAPLAELQAEQGVFFVTGNHEYFADPEGWLALLPTLGVRVLRNERVSIARGDAAFDLAGVDDHEGGRLLPGHGPDVARALAGRDPGRAVVLLAHEPRVIDEAAAHGVGLVLSGHTHGGQIWPWSHLVRLQQPFVRGMNQRGGTRVYVSDGTGLWGPPIRLGSTSEITRVVLRSARASESSGSTRGWERFAAVLRERSG